MKNKIKNSIFIHKINNLKFNSLGTQLVVMFLFEINYKQRILILDIFLIKKGFLLAANFLLKACVIN